MKAMSRWQHTFEDQIIASRMRSSTRSKERSYQWAWMWGAPWREAWVMMWVVAWMLGSRMLICSWIMCLIPRQSLHWLCDCDGITPFWWMQWWWLNWWYQWCGGECSLSSMLFLIFLLLLLSSSLLCTFELSDFWSLFTSDSHRVCKK